MISGFADRGANLNSDRIARVFEAMTVSDLTPKLGTYIMPTLVVNAVHDNALSAGTKTASVIHNSERFVLRRAGHCCFIEAPEAFDARVTVFLRIHKLMPDRVTRYEVLGRPGSKLSILASRSSRNAWRSMQASVKNVRNESRLR